MLRLGAILLLLVTVGHSYITQSNKFHDSSIFVPSSGCVPGKPCLPGQGLYQPKFQHRPVTSVKVAYLKPASKDPCIGKFVCTFEDAIKSSRLLTDLFNSFSHVSAEEFCNGKYPEILEVLTNIGAPNPEFASQQAVEAIGETVDTLTSDIVIQVYANSIAKYLFTQAVLTPQNAVQLAKKYANMMEEAANYNDSQYAALKDGFVNFLDSLGLFTADKALLIALQYGNEWKLLGRQTKYG